MVTEQQNITARDYDVIVSKWTKACSKDGEACGTCPHAVWCEQLADRILEMADRRVTQRRRRNRKYAASRLLNDDKLDICPQCGEKTFVRQDKILNNPVPRWRCAACNHVFAIYAAQKGPKNVEKRVIDLVALARQMRYTEGTTIRAIQDFLWDAWGIALASSVVHGWLKEGQ